jgi:hypothetical protein
MKSMNIFFTVIVAGIGFAFIIWRRKITITWWKYIIKENDRVFPGVFDKGWRIMDLRTPEKSWWITLWSCLFVVFGMILLFVAYTILFGPIEWIPWK